MTTLTRLLDQTDRPGEVGATPCDRHPTPGLWAPTARHQFNRAAALCGRCPIVAECLDYGQSVRANGVWGGQMLTAGKIVRPTFRRQNSARSC